ncbi:DUF4153 domain-containing protein [Novosphingobium sp.]|uniref:DUF4153 domain-containing protein n=1 Tax=Novosphingobium sp. TaxID=1874826 RepID=UPI0022BE9B6D|nr:DUF4173 domain-containing protein [Novosphingobium sp.]MCZ8019336.1 DUF4173 domain-containing protein [Novosphingobium sp.]MCZ8035151.1 DUF4173 domain-containing protein [Novosphingobium sp.]MCZ8050465.1 DUF4173 domain-containing protein [Novosphingobium sp.]MCZ8058811.1 DUF4173 domain-containing protein [Novosphingobium sp.]MCZ8232256.1 DUF4173 domain-containing protein [Novosphingobium sp.]
MTAQTFRLPRLHGSFAVKLAMAAALIALADQVFFIRELSFGWLGLFGTALALTTVLANPALRHDRRALIALTFALAMAGAMIWDAAPLPFLLFWVALGLAILLPGTARFDDGWRWAQRLIAHGFKALFGPLIDLFKLSRARNRRPVGTGLRRLLPALFLPLAGSAVILTLFTFANPVFEQAIDSLTMPLLDERTAGRIIFCGAIFVITWGVLRPRRARPYFGTFDGSGDLAIPGVNPASVLISLIAFNALFAMQNAMDLAWLWGLLPLPDGMTLADYAHRGAYPLIATALLAALFVLITLRPGSQTADNPLVRKLVTLWIAQNLVLVASSMLRLYDYIDAYSLTRLRIAALAWMALVAVGLALIGWRLLRGHSARWLINANCAAAMLLLGTYAFVDTGAFAAQWNVRHAREVDGTGAGIDLCYMAELGTPALLPLIDLEDRPLDPVLRERVRELRAQVQYRQGQMLDNGAWTLLGERRLARAEALGRQTPRAWPGARYDCSGTPQDPTASYLDQIG